MRLPLFVAKVAKDRRFVSTASDDQIDLEHQRCTIELFKDFIAQSQARGMPWFGVAHYPGSKIGTHSRMYVDGHFLKMEGQFDTGDPMAEAAYDSLRRDKDAGLKRIQTSVGFYPSRARLEGDGVLAYTRGWVEHNALTTAPANPRTDIVLAAKANNTIPRATTMYEDALMIVGREHADKLEKTYRERRIRRSANFIYLGEGDYGPGAKSTAIVDELLYALRGALDEGVQLPWTVPLVLAEELSDDLAEVSEVGAALVLQSATVRSLVGSSGLVPLEDPEVITTLRSVLAYLAANQYDIAGLDQADDVELIAALDKSTTRTNAYLQKMLELTSASIPPRMLDAYHRHARAHAGGKASPMRQMPTAMETMALNKLTKRDIDKLDDDELEHVHARVHALYKAALDDEPDDTPAEV